MSHIRVSDTSFLEEEKQRTGENRRRRRF